MSDYTELKRLAEAATPGPWIEVDDEDSAAGAVFIVPVTDVWRPTICRITAEYDAAFITSANPAVVLELIAENERLRSGMKGDYGLDAWLDWSREAEALRSQLIEQAAISNDLAQEASDANELVIELRKDADRYRLLRSGEICIQEDSTSPGCSAGIYVWDQRAEKYQECGRSISGGELDAAIDAAMSKEPKA